MSSAREREFTSLTWQTVAGAIGKLLINQPFSWLWTSLVSPNNDDNNDNNSGSETFPFVSIISHSYCRLIHTLTTVQCSSWCTWFESELNEWFLGLVLNALVNQSTNLITILIFLPLPLSFALSPKILFFFGDHNHRSCPVSWHQGRSICDKHFLLLLILIPCLIFFGLVFFAIGRHLYPLFNGKEF